MARHFAELRVESLELRYGVSAHADTFFICCPVGRGDPTPPGELVVAERRQGGVKTPPYITNL